MARAILQYVWSTALASLLRTPSSPRPESQLPTVASVLTAKQPNVRINESQASWSLSVNRNIETGRLGKKGAFTIPAALRKRFGLSDGSLLIAEECEGGIMLRPAIAAPIELYTDERAAEFLLSNAVDQAEYEAAREEVRAMGLVPDRILHRKPPLNDPRLP